MSAGLLTAVGVTLAAHTAKLTAT